MRVRRQFLNEDNWPVPTVYENRNEPVSHYEADRVLGTYELIDHGTKNSGTML